MSKPKSNISTKLTTSAQELERSHFGQTERQQGNWGKRTKKSDMHLKQKGL